MKNKKLTIFLSHSHQDEETLRKIRDVLEILNCEPLIFFLKCLDDNNTELEDFIKREIEARNIFLYCKSSNAEHSVWVQKELEYIKSFDEKRLYEIDIENGFESGIVNLLICIQNIIKNNKVFILGTAADKQISLAISEYLAEKGMLTVGDALEYGRDIEYHQSIVNNIDAVAKEGKFLVLCTPDMLKNEMIMSAIELIAYREGECVLIKLKGDNEIYDSKILRYYFGTKINSCIEIDREITAGQLKEIYGKLKR